MAFHVSLVGRRDLSGEIYRQIRRAILDGRLAPGDRLPATRELARALAVSRMTATVAYERLAGEGFTTSRVGAGTYVSEDAAHWRSAPSRRSSGALKPRAAWNGVSLPSAFEYPARYDFRTGLPDMHLFPHRAWARLVARTLRSLGPAGGMYEHSAGHRELRSALARHVGTARAVGASADDIVVTNGTQQALDVAARALLAPGDCIAVEDPGYQPPRYLFQSLGLRVVAVPVDREGLVVDALPKGARAVYVTPSHQYPLGVAMTLPRRQALLAWAERNGAAIIEDDYDSEFRFGGRPLEPLQTLDAAGHVVYIGSFSKTMLPGLRLGFLVAPASLHLALHKAKFVSDWHTSTLLQLALARFIEDGGYARHIRRMSAVYRERHRILRTMLAREFADHLEVIPSDTGLHITATARAASIAEIAAVARRAREAGVAVQTLSSFCVHRPAHAGLMLGYGAIAANQIGAGLRRLRSCFG